MGEMAETPDDWAVFVHRAIAGDEVAFAAIYERTRENVYRTVALLVNRQTDAKEITQDVYEELWRTLRRYDDDRPFLPWLHGIVIRQVRNYRRTQWRHWRKLKMVRENQRIDLHGMALDEVIVISQQGGQLMSMVDALPLKLREVILLRYFHGYTLAEAAKILHIPAGTARSRHHQAMLCLRASFDEAKEGDKACLLNEN